MMGGYTRKFAGCAPRAEGVRGAVGDKRPPTQRRHEGRGGSRFAVAASSGRRRGVSGARRHVRRSCGCRPFDSSPRKFAARRERPWIRFGGHAEGAWRIPQAVKAFSPVSDGGTKLQLGSKGASLRPQANICLFRVLYSVGVRLPCFAILPLFQPFRESVENILSFVFQQSAIKIQSLPIIER